MNLGTGLLSIPSYPPELIWVAGSMRIGRAQ
jgi:hypothetical protein